MFLVGQLLSVAHALEFGPEPHEHHGASCVALLLDDPFVPSGSLSPGIEFRGASSDIVPPARQRHSSPPAAFQPPPTGPPINLS